jgi:putative ABC transport system permease protein
MSLLSIFALAALLLAAVGVYGVVNYSAAQRTGEIGIRMALGAERQDIFKLIVGQYMARTIIGVVVGMGVSVYLTRFISSLLFGVSATDYATFIGVTLLLISVALLACYIPAHRAARVNPIDGLRHG